MKSWVGLRWLSMLSKHLQMSCNKIHLKQISYDCNVHKNSWHYSKKFCNHFEMVQVTKLGFAYHGNRLLTFNSQFISSPFSGWNTFTRRYYATDADKFSLKNELFKKYVESILCEYNELYDKRTAGESLMRQESARLNELTPLKETYDELTQKYEELQELQKLEADDDMKELVEEEKGACVEEIAELEEQMVDLLIPRESIDENDVILEVESGAGGQEAMLFAQSIFNMYLSHAAYKGWEFTVLNTDETSLGGIRSASATVSGQGVYRELKFEGGIHRVQRIPVTEKGGRIHTSTISVAILPQPSEIDLTIQPKDLRVETTAGSGPGGQHAQKNETAVRMTHIPTGVTVSCSQERSQIQNKKLALAVLRSRLYNKKLEEDRGKVTSQRKIQVGNKERSEKIRTYNYPQGRITDHRIGRTVYNIDLFLQGGENLDAMVQELLIEAKREELEEKVLQFDKDLQLKAKERK